MHLTLDVGEMENVIFFSTPQAIAMMEETAKVVKYHPVTMKIAAIEMEDL